MAIALARIAEEKQKLTGKLDLGGLDLTSLPDPLFGLKHLRELNVGNSTLRGLEPIPNRINAQKEKIKLLSSLRILSVAASDVSDLDFLRELPDLLELNCSNTKVRDVTPLATLHNLQRLYCYETPVSDLAPLTSLGKLEALFCDDTEVSDLTPLASLRGLRKLGFGKTLVSDLSPLAALQDLQSLDCSGTPVSTLKPLASFRNLERLVCVRTRVPDLTPLTSLKSLKWLFCAHTPVSDLAPLKFLEELSLLDCKVTGISDLKYLANLRKVRNIDCSGTRVSDLRPLVSLKELTVLSISNTRVSDLRPLASLGKLRELSCDYTSVSDLKPLASLVELRELRCGRTGISNLAPLASLAKLRVLDCRDTCVSDLTPLSALDSLEFLICNHTDVSDLTPLLPLGKLVSISFSECRLQPLPRGLLEKPSLKFATLHGTHVPGVPPTGILSNDFFDNCLERLRAHFTDLDADAEIVPDVKLMLLGNGGAGKTQIARWLAGQPFDEAWNSTHGIEIITAALPGDPPIRLHAWDFGGQDIYHGTHALFLRSPAILVLVWATDTETRESHRQGGMTFRDHPLDYWIDLARHQGDHRSPMIIVQTKCDTQKLETRKLPGRTDVLDELPYCKTLHVSTREGRGKAAFDEALREAAGWLRDPERVGPVRIGAGRLRVQRRLEALRESHRNLPADRRRHRLMGMDAFESLCAEQGGVSSPAHLLTYLDANGTVFYRPGLFGDRIVLDQAWALDAIYAVFDRERCLREIRRSDGRFTRPMLADLVWREYGEDEQKLFLGMMRSCGICFMHRRSEDPNGWDEADGEYIAPDLLPERAAVENRLSWRWNADAPGETAVFRYPILHGGMIRTLMARVGEMAGQDALYWQGGFCVHEATTGSWLLIEQEMTGRWQGEIRVRTQCGQAVALLDRMVRLVERTQTRLGLQSEERTTGTVSPPVVAEVPEQEAPEQEAMTFGPARPGNPHAPEWYVSYAWGEDTTREGRERERVVDELCAAAEKRGRRILRDKNVLGLGDSIPDFMRRIGEGKRIFVILSDKYVHSPYCMLELTEIWRTSRQQERDFLERIRILVLPDAPRIDRPVERVKLAAYWKKEHDDLNALVQEHGAGVFGDTDHRQLKQMQRFYAEVSDILAALSSQVRPRTVEQLIEWGFDDPKN
ncbi:COR domain-containing protein [Skermanella pratensis]|uniref:COR domain-containing protein n=1 Tax=Skermanella pratensis TaxID=2233999 RepID=UPI001788870E|nr:COR domain-containing protein [Skermanella pratensis]